MPPMMVRSEKPTPAELSLTKPNSGRILALDAYRGFIMVSLVGSECFETVKAPGRPLYRAIASQFGHRPWGGAVFYDLIMPAFLFMVGVAMSYSIGRRMEQGDSKRELFKHFIRRAIILIIISELIISIETNHLHLQFHNILTQVAFTSILCFFIMQLRPRYQVALAVLMLVFHSALYLIFPGPDGPFQPVTNFGAVLDRFIMGHNYRMAPAVNLNTICETVNVLAGIWAGNLLRSSLVLRKKFLFMFIAMAIAFTAGLAISPVVPINKWLWTGSYTLYTIGWSIFGLILFYFLDVVVGLRKSMFFFVVIGMNSLVVYCIGELLVGWLGHSVEVLTQWVSVIGEPAPMVQAALTFLVIWCFAYWLYRNKIFIRA
jgi:heparan-alpha-glucosaminide N-acetyltransferase